jgi:hypothetical protein
VLDVEQEGEAGGAREEENSGDLIARKWDSMRARRVLDIGYVVRVGDDVRLAIV